MSKPIVLTEEILQEWMKEFETKARSTKMTGGKFTYTQEIEYEGEDKVKIIFTPSAYIKMLTLLREFSDEVAWHGIVDRHGDDGFVISDILVYPQEVTGSTVNTDQEEYTKWMNAIPMDTFNRMHMQGHSHVNMQVNPSAVDLNHQESIVSQLHGDHFYIFMIWNKRLEHNIKVYDFRENTLYEDKDCVVTVAARGFDTIKFVQDAKDQVKRKSYLQSQGSGFGQNGFQWNRGQNYGGATTPQSASDEVRSAVTVKSEEKKGKKEKGSKKKEVKSSAKSEKPAQQSAAQQKIIMPDEPSPNRVLDGVTDFDKFVYGGMSR